MRRQTQFLKHISQKGLIVFVAVSLLAGPLALLQTVAWVEMFAVYSARSGLSQGLEQTFSQEHPCSLCLAIQKHKPAREQAPAFPTPESPKLRIALGCAPEISTALRSHVPDSWILPKHVYAMSAEIRPPPVPPPRSCA